MGRGCSVQWLCCTIVRSRAACSHVGGVGAHGVGSGCTTMGAAGGSIAGCHHAGAPTCHMRGVRCRHSQRMWMSGWLRWHDLGMACLHIVRAAQGKQACTRPTCTCPAVWVKVSPRDCTRGMHACGIRKHTPFAPPAAGPPFMWLSFSNLPLEDGCAPSLGFEKEREEGVIPRCSSPLPGPCSSAHGCMHPSDDVATQTSGGLWRRGKTASVQ